MSTYYDLGRVVGPQGPTGAAGPNQVTAATATDLTGVLAGNGSSVVVKAVDATPASGSSNLITSGAVYTAILGAIGGSY